MDLVNPLMTEIANLSPGAQQALVHAHTAMGGPGAATHAATTPAPSLAAPSAPSTPMMGASAPPNLGEPNAPTLTGHHGTSLTLSHATEPGAPPAMSAPSTPPMPSLSAPSMPSVSPPIRGTEQGDQLERQRLLSTGPGIEQIHSKIENSQFGQNHPTLGKIAGWGAEIPLHVLEAAGSMFGPTRTAEMLLPGTTAHHALELRNLNSQIGHEAEENLKGAQAGEAGARAGLATEQTNLAPGEAASREAQEAATVRNLDSEVQARSQGELEVHDTDAGPLLINKKTGAAQHVDLNGQPVGPKLKLTQSQPIIDPKDGQPHTYMLDEKGNKVVDLGKHYERPINVNAGSNHEFAMNERGRGLLDKAEGNYRTAQQGAQTIRAMIDDAMHSGKISARVLPLEGALEVTGANGVHRINRTEVEQYAGAGSLFDRLMGSLRGAESGIPFTNEIMQDMKRLADIQERGAYANYKGAYDSATKRYHLEDEQALPEPGGSGGNNITVTAPNGKSYSFKDQASADAFKAKAGIK